MGNDKSWAPIDVIDYFGDEVEEMRKWWSEKKGIEHSTECVAEDLMAYVEGRVGSGATYFQKMNDVRDVLKGKGFMPPFRSVYRRAKL